MTQVLGGVRMTEEQFRAVMTDCFGGPDGDGGTEPDLDSTVVCSMWDAGVTNLHFAEREDSSLITRFELHHGNGSVDVYCKDGSRAELKVGSSVNHGRPA